MLNVSRADIFWGIYIAVGFFALDNFYAFQRISDIGINVLGDRSLIDHFKQLVFLLPHLIAIAAIIACLKLRRIFAVPILIAIALLTIIDLTVHKIVGMPANLTQIAVLNGAARLAGDAVSEFRDSVISSALITLAFFVPLFARVFYQKKSGSIFLFAAPLAMLAAMYVGLLMIKGETSLIGFPRGFSYGFGTISLKVNDVINSFSKPVKLETESLPDKKSSKIIVVIDESVAYEQFASLLPVNENFVDYGQSYSGSNCSGASNLIIRKGGWIRGTHKDKLRIGKIENLFALAKKANYPTIYVDNQDVLDNPTENYLSDDEISAIDKIVRADEAYFDRDIASLDRIGKLIAGERVFMLINKAGTHFPYKNSIAPELRTGEKLQDYRKSLQVNSINFLSRLAEVIDSETIVFYTSDHGQNFEGRKPHCGQASEITEAEYAVPFVVITKNDATSQLLKEKLDTFRDKLTHIEFSESVRNAMGFRVDGIDSIFEAEPKNIGKNLCGHYGDPHPIFGVDPGCVLLK